MQHASRGVPPRRRPDHGGHEGEIGQLDVGAHIEVAAEDEGVAVARLEVGRLQGVELLEDVDALLRQGPWISRA